MITGGYAGVGAQLSGILYQHNATVWIAGRSQEKADKAIKKIQADHPISRGTLHFLSIDLSDLTTIKPAAEKFLASSTKLHWLNQNAGVMVPPKGSKGAQGMDITYQTNIVGPFLLTKLLLPVLKSTAASEPKSSVRVSWAGSLAVVLMSPKQGVQYTADGTDLEFGLVDPQKAYGTSKAANYYLGSAFGKLSGNTDGILHNSYNPGNLETELQRHTDDQYPAIAQWLLRRLLYPAVFGAYTELYAGLSKDLDVGKDQGAYIVPWGRKWGTRADLEAEVAKEKGADLKLYEWCDGVTKQYQ